MHARPASPLAFTLSPRAALPLYVAVLAALESYFVFVDAFGGAFALVLLLAVMVNHHLFRPASAAATAAAGGSRAIVALALVPVIQLGNVTLSTVATDDLYKEGLATLPIAAAAAWAIVAGPWRVGGGSQLRRTSLVQVGGWGLALSGAALGFVAYLLIQPATLALSERRDDLVVAALIVSVAAIVEEVIFRGLVQGAVADVYPRSAALWSTAAYVISSLPARPEEFVVVAAVAGLLFGIGVQLTGSIVGAAVGHVLLNIGLFVVWPVVLT
jgi:membrane protease YdiL (CAAX protease family)